MASLLKRGLITVEMKPHVVTHMHARLTELGRRVKYQNTDE